MNGQFQNLMSPLKINSVILRNRIISSPTSQGDVNHDGTLNEHNIAYYARKAQGGAALVVIGDGIVHPTGQNHPYQVRLYTDDCLPSLTRCAEEIHKYGALCSYELSHGGIVCNPAFINGERPYGPSEIPVSIGFQTNDPVTIYTQEMTESFMELLTEAYGQAAARCKLAGFDMVMVHAGHGWLLDQFFSPYSNKRDDKYGGSVENRCRFAIMVLKKIRDYVGERFPIDIRINGEDGMEEGLSLKDSVEICKCLEPYVDSFHVSSCFHLIPEHQDIMQSTIFMKRGHLVHLASEIKKAVNKPVATVGGHSYPEEMETIIREGKADMIALGRQLLADPDIANKIHSGHPERIRHCLRCANCQSGRFTRQTARCSVNPEIGREYEVQFERFGQGKPKKVLIAGGGPAGMEAAIMAAKSGHDVSLYEASGQLGGALHFAQYIPFKADLYQLIKSLEAEVYSLPIKVNLNTVLTPEMAEKECADAVIAAVGAQTIKPSFSGSEMEKVWMAEDADRESEQLKGENVVVIGGGLVGIETAINQALRGKKVTIVEMQKDIAQDANFRYKRTYIWKIEELGIRVCTETKCLEIDEQGIKCLQKSSEIHIPADVVIIAIGMRPNEELAESFRNCAPQFRSVGTCVRPCQVMEAMRSGYDAGRFL